MKQNLGQYRSLLEKQFATQYPDVPYEEVTLDYVQHRTYTPDFQLAPDIFVETKGYLRPSDRQKQLLVKTQYPNAIFVLVFQDPNKVLTKHSKTTYSNWASKHGFKSLGIKDLQMFKNKEHFIKWARA